MTQNELNLKLYESVKYSHMVNFLKYLNLCADINYWNDKEDNNIFRKACIVGDFSIFEYIYNNKSFKLEDPDKEKSIFFASYNGNYKIVSFLLNEGFEFKFNHYDTIITSIHITSFFQAEGE